jgi:hypothetical protein
MTKTRLTTLVSLLLLPLSLLLSACGQTSQPGAHSHQSNNLSIYVLTTSYLTRAPGITKLDAKTHKPLWHTQPALSDVAFLIANEHLVVTGDHIYLSLFASFKMKPSNTLFTPSAPEMGKNSGTRNLRTTNTLTLIRLP